MSTLQTEALLKWRGVTLHPLRDTDLGWLRQAELGDYLAFRWRLRGEHVPQQRRRRQAIAAFFYRDQVRRQVVTRLAPSLLDGERVDSVRASCGAFERVESVSLPSTFYRGQHHSCHKEPPCRA